MVDIENPWNIASIYDLQFFNCPTCDFKDYTKQELVNHAYDFHPNSIPFLINIKDESLIDVNFPWDVKDIKKEPEVELTETKENEEIKTEIVKEESKDNNVDDDYYIDDPDYTNPEDMNTDFHCKKCDKYFPSKIKHKNHVRNAHGESVKCEKCNKVFKSQHNYRKHVKYIHEDVRNYKCKLCDKAFHQMSGLKGITIKLRKC